MTGTTHSATIVITTRNRKDELRNALRSALSQDVPAEVIVTDDGSEDGTAAMVGEEFPSVKVLRTEGSVGLITQRNRAASVAAGSIIFSIDDDAEFGSADTVRQTLAEFSDERVGAIAIPHKDTVTNKVVNAAAPADGKVWCVAAYTGTAHAVRRDVFQKLRGYREDLVHQGEESDFCIRMLAAGLVTRLGRAPLIQHHESPRRSFARMDFYGRRNDIFFAWRHAPSCWLAPHLVGTSWHGLRDAANTGRWRTQGSGMLEGWRMIARGAALREPVPRKVYAAFRMLRRHGPKPMEEILPLLPPLR
jgi:GT2 family glycosyltransferase